MYFLKEDLDTSCGACPRNELGLGPREFDMLTVLLRGEAIVKDCRVAMAFAKPSRPGEGNSTPFTSSATLVSLSSTPDATEILEELMHVAERLRPRFAFVKIGFLGLRLNR